MCLQFLSWPAPLLQGGCRTGRNTSCLASNLPGAKLLWHPVSRQDGCASTTASWMNEACSFQLISSALGFQGGFYQNKPCVSQTRVGLAIFANLAYSGQVRCLLRHLKLGSQRLWLLLVFRLCGEDQATRWADPSTWHCPPNHRDEHQPSGEFSLTLFVQVTMSVSSVTK